MISSISAGFNAAITSSSSNTFGPVHSARARSTLARSGNDRLPACWYATSLRPTRPPRRKSCDKAARPPQDDGDQDHAEHELRQTCRARREQIIHDLFERNDKERAENWARRGPDPADDRNQRNADRNAGNPE